MDLKICAKKTCNRSGFALKISSKSDHFSKIYGTSKSVHFHFDLTVGCKGPQQCNVLLVSKILYSFKNTLSVSKIFICLRNIFSVSKFFISLRNFLSVSEIFYQSQKFFINLARPSNGAYDRHWYSQLRGFCLKTKSGL